MNLLIDAGNSRVKWALQNTDYWSTGSSGRSDFASALKNSIDPGLAPGKVFVSSTRSQAFNHQLSLLIHDLFDLQAVFICSQRRAYGIINRYEPAESLGADRWAAMVAARSISHTAAIVIDCGTAVTIDALNTDGVFEGGVIFPGLELSLDALNKADNLVIGEKVLTNVFARTTQQAMYSGVIYSMAGAISGIVLEMRKKLGQGVSVYMCGGDAEKFYDLVDHRVIREPDMVLKGLEVIAE